MERKITYFEEIGPENTAATLKIARERVGELGVRRIVFASTSGATARLAADFFRGSGARLVVIPHQFDFHRRENPFPPELVRALREEGHAVHFGTMLFHTDGLYGTGVAAAIANMLRCFSQGVKVCFEIVLMATDAGLVAMRRNGHRFQRDGSRCRYGAGHASCFVPAPEESPGERDSLQAP